MPKDNKIHYRQKIWNIFYFSDFLHSCGVCRVFLYLKYEQISFLGELISTWQQNEAERFKNNYIGSFLN